MLKQPCKHIWEKSTDASREYGAGTISATFVCRTCSTQMTASEVFQLEALEGQNELTRHQLGFQKWLAIIVAIIAFSSLVVSIASLVTSVSKYKTGFPLSRE